MEYYTRNGIGCKIYRLAHLDAVHLGFTIVGYHPYIVVIHDACQHLSWLNQLSLVDIFPTHQWNRTGFSLFDITDLSKITDIKKWTNKTAKLKDVLAEIDAIQKKTFDELKILEQFPQEDVSLLKTVYLDTLSITEAMQKANQLKANRERLAREQREREEVERFKKIQEQKKDEWKEEKKAESENESVDLASAALGLEIKAERTETREEYALVFSLTRSQFLDLRNYMSDHGITYSELQDKGSGVYTK